MAPPWVLGEPRQVLCEGIQDRASLVGLQNVSDVPGTVLGLGLSSESRDCSLVASLKCALWLQCSPTGGSCGGHTRGEGEGRAQVCLESRVWGFAYALGVGRQGTGGREGGKDDPSVLGLNF